MTVQISSLRVAPEIDATKYVAGAQQIDAADKVMVSGKQAVGQAFTTTDAKISQAGDVLARLSRQYEQGYASQQKFNQGLGQLNRGLESGKISIEGAERILVGMNQKLGLMGDASDLAAKGQLQLAAAVKAANAQIAGQAIAAENAAASAKRMQAANGNAPVGRQNNFAALNATNQFQDIAITAAMGQSISTIALQQGTQLGMAMQMSAGATGAMGAVKMLGSAITGLFTPVNLAAIGITAAAAATIQWFMKGKDGAKSLDESLKAHSDTLRLLKDQYGQLGEAAKTAGNVGGLAFTGANARDAQTLLQAQIREKSGPFLDTLGGVGWIQGLLGNGGGIAGLRDLGGDQKQFAAPMAALIDSAKNGKTDLAAFNDEVERLFSKALGTSDNPAALRATADAVALLGANAFEVTGKFAPFGDAINRLKVESADGKPNLSAFNAEVERIGRANGLQKLADEAIIAGKEIVDLAEKAAELEKILQRIDREETRPGLADRRALGGYISRRAADLGIQNDQFAADQQMARARTNAERLAAVEAQVRARALEDGDKGGGIQARVDRALAAERNRQAIELRDATDERHRSQLRSIEAAKEEMSLIGATAGEAARLNYQFSELARLKEEAAKTGGIVSDDEVRRIKETAVELGKIADARARLNLNNDLDFERSQMFLSPQEREIASRLRGTGIGMDSPEAQKMRDITKFGEAKDLASGFLNGFKSELLNSGGDVGKALGNSILNALMNSMDKQWEAIFDRLAVAFASALTGKTAGGGGIASAGAGIVGAILGGANDNYAPGAVTRAPLPNIGGGSAYSVENATSFIRQYASAIGIDSDVALRVARSEGLASGVWQSNLVRNGIREPSFGPFQLLKGGQGTGYGAGLGNAFMAKTGLDPADPANWQQSTAFALDQAKASGWGAWYGAKGQGITGFMGIDQSATKAVGALDKLAVSSVGTAKELAGGLGKLGSSLGQFPAAPSGGGGLLSMLGGLFGGGLNSAFSGTKAFSWLSANPGGFIGLYANGTENAPPGWAWVGEKGPELMRMRGGETIRSNQRSAQMVAENSNRAPAPAPKVELHTHVYGGSGDDHIRRLVDEGNRTALANFNQSQERGGFGRTQQKFASYKG